MGDSDFPSIIKVLGSFTDYRNSTLFKGSQISILQLSGVVLCAQQYFSLSFASIEYILKIIDWILADIAKCGIEINSNLPTTALQCRNVIADMTPVYHRHKSCNCGYTLLYCKECKAGSSQACVFCGTEEQTQNHEILAVPILQILKMLHECPLISRGIQAVLHTAAEPDLISDVCQSPAYVDLKQAALPNTTDIALILESDGINANKFLGSGQYGITFNSFAIANLPQNLCNNPVLIIPTAIICGPRMPKSCNASDESMAIEINKLRQGVPGVLESATGKLITLKADVLCLVGDNVGLNKRFCRPGATSYAGDPYSKELRGTRLNHLKMMSFPLSRRFLPYQHPYRQCKVGFVSQAEENGSIPQFRKDMPADVAEEFRKMCVRISELNAKSAESKELVELQSQYISEYGRNKSCTMQTSAVDATSKTLPDWMHTLTNVIKRIWAVVNGHADSLNLRLQEKQLGRFPETWPNEAGKLPPAPWRLTHDGLKTACDRFQRISYPHHTDAVDSSITGICDNMNSADWHGFVVSGSFEYVICGLLGNEQETSLIELIGCIRELLANTISIKSCLMLDDRIHAALCSMEKHWPAYIQTLMLHSWNYFARFLLRFGPCNGLSMFKFERFNRTMGNCMTKKQKREINIIETWKVNFTCFLLTQYGILPPWATKTHAEAKLGKVKRTIKKDLNASAFAKVEALTGGSIVTNSIYEIKNAKRVINGFNQVVTYAPGDLQSRRASFVIYRRSQLQTVQFGRVASLFHVNIMKRSDGSLATEEVAEIHYFVQHNKYGYIYKVDLTNFETVYAQVDKLSPPLSFAYDSAESNFLHVLGYSEWMLMCSDQ